MTIGDGTADRALLEALASEAASHAGLVASGGAGVCLPVTAALCRVLVDAGVSDVVAVAGSYEGDAHWWVRVGDRIVDGTRHQFGPGSLVCALDEAGYEVEEEFPPGWTDEHVALEAYRVFRFREIGKTFAEGLLGRLRLVVNDFHDR
jgi:hypothetical protein